MWHRIPAQLWLLLAIAVFAAMPLRYVYRYFAHAPARDLMVMRPAEDLGWRTQRQLVYNLALLAALAAFAVFIFTPVAGRLARAPGFLPILIGIGGLWALSTVARGLANGRIEPFVRGFNNSYERSTQPRRFWASLSWNLIFGCLCLWLGFQQYTAAAAQALTDLCYDTKTAHTPQEALSACNQLIREHGTASALPAGLFAARGSAYFRLGDFGRALSDYDHAIQLDPHTADLRYDRGLTDARLGDRARAVTDFSDAIRMQPDNADAYLARGLIFLDAGRFDEAVADFTRVHALRPKDMVALADRGISYAWRKDAVSAEQDFAAVRAIDPSNPVLLHGEAVLSLNAGDLNAALDHLNASLRRAPADQWALAMRAETYQRLGKDDEARADADALQRMRDDAGEIASARH